MIVKRNNNWSVWNVKKILYVKGGNAVEEGARLVKQRGKVIKGGADQFLLAVLSILGGDDLLRVVTFGKENKSAVIDKVELIEYSLRKTSQLKIMKFYYFVSTLVRFFLTSSIFKPQIILCGLDGPVGGAALICAKLSGAKFIFSSHNALHGQQVSKIYKVPNKFLAIFSDQILVHGEFLAAQLLELGADEKKLIEYVSSIDEHELNFINQFKNNVDTNQIKKKTILYVGRIEEDKGVFDLLEAFCLAKLIDTDLVYLGDGSALAGISAMVAERNLTNVRLLGRVSHLEVYKHLCNASVLISPSRSRFPEGRCMSVEEALIAGIAVIAPDYGAFPYLVTDQVNGLLYQSDSVVSLSKAIENVIKNPYLLEHLKAGAVESGKLLMEGLTFTDALMILNQGDVK